MSIAPIGDRELFTLSYWLDSKRYRKVFPTLDQAIDAAKDKGKQLSKGDILCVHDLHDLRFDRAGVRC